MNIMRSYLLLFLTVFCTNFTFSQEAPTNIILMIGDGTGLSQITAGMYAPMETKPT